MTSGPSKAIHSARATLILGLIVFHTARVFDPFDFYVKSPVQVDALGPLILFGVIWGMPLFFFIAGYALWHSLNARGTGEFVRERVTRLLLPFIACVVLLVPPQIYVQRRVSGDPVSYLRSLSEFLDVHLALQFPIPVTGSWFEAGHLWFLAYLFAFTLMLLPALVWLKRRSQVPELLARHTTAVWVTVAVALVAAEGILGTEETGGWNRWTFLVFLALGVLLAIQPRLGEPMAQRRRLIVVYALVGFVALAASGELLQDHLGGTLSTSQALDPMLWRACKGITGLLFLMAIVGSLVGYESQRPAPAAQGASRTSAFLSYMGRISLPVYIVHQTFVVLLGFWILQLSIPAPVQWLALAVLTLALSVSTVEIASRTRLGRLLLGMRPRHRKPESAAPSVAVKPPARQPAGREPELVPSPLV